MSQPFGLRLTMQPRCIGKEKPQIMKLSADYYYGFTYLKKLYFLLTISCSWKKFGGHCTFKAHCCIVQRLTISPLQSHTAEAGSSPDWATAEQLVSSAQLSLELVSAFVIIAYMKNIHRCHLVCNINLLLAWPFNFLF